MELLMVASDTKESLKKMTYGVRRAFAVLGVAAFSLGVAHAAQAASTGYECKIDQNRSNKGWVPEVVFIGHNDQSGAVTVSDPIIFYFHDKKPIAGRVATSNNKRITFTWKIDGKDRRNQKVRAQYRLTYLRGSGRVSMQARPLGFEDIFTAGGTCKTKPIK
jgi:hypothetical protein